jgi:hypothetical protein
MSRSLGSIFCDNEVVDIVQCDPIGARRVRSRDLQCRRRATSASICMYWKPSATSPCYGPEFGRPAQLDQFYRGSAWQRHAIDGRQLEIELGWRTPENFETGNHEDCPLVHQQRSLGEDHFGAGLHGRAGRAPPVSSATAPASAHATCALSRSGHDCESSLPPFRSDHGIGCGAGTNVRRGRGASAD